MLCQICHSAEASVYLIENIDNKQTTMHICENCAQKKHLGEMLSKPALAIHELLASLLQLGGIPLPQQEELKCSRCGMSFTRFKQIGRFGCPACYDSFREHLLPLFRQFHQAEEHKGRVERKPEASVQAELSQLKEQLKQAVGQEQFEQAAQLRDRIRTLGGNVSV